MSLRLAQYAGPYYLALAATAAAATPVAKIDEGDSVTVASGEGFVLHSTTSSGDGPVYWHMPTVHGLYDGASLPCLFPPRDGTYRIEQFRMGIVSGTPLLASAVTTVTVGGAPGPTPPTPVPPGPNPPSPTPEDKFHLIEAAQNAGQVLPASAKALLPQLAANFTAAAAAATSVLGMQKDAFDRNQATMGQLKPQFVPLADALQKGLQAANISTVPDGQLAYAEIAYGLSQVH